MSNAALKSPFAAVNEEEPWVLWQAKHPISRLVNKKETDVRSDIVVQERECTPIHTETVVKTQISRPQYHAVLNRIKHASEKVTNYSAWSN